MNRLSRAGLIHDLLAWPVTFRGSPCGLGYLRGTTKSLDKKHFIVEDEWNEVWTNALWSGEVVVENKKRASLWNWQNYVTRSCVALFPIPRPRSHRTCKHIVQTLRCCLQAVWALQWATVGSIFCVGLLQSAPHPVWMGPKGTHTHTHTLALSLSLWVSFFICLMQTCLSRCGLLSLSLSLWR